MLSRYVIAFLPRSKRLLVSWLQSPYAVILEPKKIKSVTVSIVSPFICHEVMGLDAMILIFWMLSFKPAFSLSFFTFIKRFFSSSSLSTIRVVSAKSWHPTPVLLPGESHGQRSLVGYSPRGRKELDTTEQLHSPTHSSNLDSSLCFIEPGISHDVLCI